MNISQRLRTCARHTGLDSVIELLQEAADEIDALQACAQVQGEPATVAVDHFDNGPFEAYTNRIYPHVEIGTKLYTHQAPSVPGDVVRDAERYRWLSEQNESLESFTFYVGCDNGPDDDGSVEWVGADLDAAIDAAMLAAK